MVLIVKGAVTGNVETEFGHVKSPLRNTTYGGRPYTTLTPRGMQASVCV